MSALLGSNLSLGKYGRQLRGNLDVPMPGTRARPKIGELVALASLLLVCSSHPGLTPQRRSNWSL